MSALSNYNSLSKQTKRFVWIGYAVYSAYVWLFHGFDDFIENITPTDNPFALMAVAIGLYWLVVFAILWATDD